MGETKALDSRQRTTQTKVHKTEKPWRPEIMRAGAHSLERQIKQGLRGHIQDSLS